MESRNRFLTAEWKNIVMLNYTVDASLLEPFLPYGTELDTFAGKLYMSLVGFEFNRTRLLGFAVPFHQSFEEVNLRFYVRRASKRGVVFIRELVPKRAVAAVAQFAFHENYSCVPMSHRVEARAQTDIVEAEYTWGTGPSRCRMHIETEGPGLIPIDGSESQFIAEHYWGYAAQPDGGCLEYEVQHPPWRVRKANRAEFSGSVTRLYGPEIAQALSRKPDSAYLAEGSAVTVYKGTRIDASPKYKSLIFTQRRQPEST
jgi:uncharacterized protein YqjF (DUF2071 family)